MSPTTTRILENGEDLSDWDLEELRAGRRRASDGSFRGRNAKIVPAAVHEELLRRTMSAGFSDAKMGFSDAIRLWRDVINDPDEDMAFRLKASELLVDRVLGKAAQPIYVGTTADEKSRWGQMVAASVFGVVGTEEQARALGSGMIVDGEVVDESAKGELSR